MLTPTEARAALATLVAAAVGDMRDAWTSGAQWLEQCDGRTWMLLDDVARAYGPADSYGVPVSGTRGWLSSSLNEPTGFVAAITSLHADGRIRQRATQVLAGQPGRLRAVALAVRCLDHVAQVRDDALAGLLPQAGAEGAEVVLGVLLAGRGRQYAPETLIAFLGQLEATLSSGDLLDLLRDSRDRRVRRWAHVYAHDRALLDADALTGLVGGEPDQWLRAEAARWLGEVADVAQLARLLDSRFVDGRLLALTKLDDADLSTDQIRALLEDPFARVRESAQWRARRRGFDVPATYRNWLSSGERTGARLAATLDALASLGTAADADLVASQLNSGNVRVRASAAAAVAALADAASARSLLRPVLLDDSPRVATAAARGLTRAGATGADAETAWADSERPWTRRAAWRLSRGGGGWDRVVADLRAASDPDAALNRLGRAGLRNWLDTAAATTWGHPSAAQGAQIEQLLLRVGLSPRERCEVAFHAGIKLEPEAALPAATDAVPTRRGLLRMLRRT
jgi:hypothetical protein